MKETQLNQAQAIDVLIQAVRLAQAKGAFTLEDAELVSRAIKVFIPEKQAEPASEAETENVAAESVEPVLERVV
jgi:gamma-glutamyltranspeptidase